MRIVIFDAQKWEVEKLKKELKGNSLQFFDVPLNEQNVKTTAKAEIISIFINSKITKELLGKMPKLRLIATRSTGFDHIDLRECKKRKIIVSNVPAYGENTVAEHTFALILALSRKVHKSYLRTLRGDYSIEGLQGFDLAGKTLGVIGVGKIGKHVVRIARGFEMKVLASDKHPDDFLAEEMNFKYVHFEEVLKKSDIVTLHIPYAKDNYHLMNKKTFALMKKGAILINTSRGEIVDTVALNAALEAGKLSGAGLDVLEGEELIKEERELLNGAHRNIAVMKQIAADHVLLSKDNVVFTPHIAFYSHEALARIVEQTIRNIKDFIRGHVAQDCVVC